MDGRMEGFVVVSRLGRTHGALYEARRDAEQIAAIYDHALDRRPAAPHHVVRMVVLRDDEEIVRKDR